jgi:REP-associated tyrosine transposase
MARLPRVVAVDVPHHVTQRGNARQAVFSQDADRITYLELLRQYAELYSLSVLGYCLMSNHVHLIVLPCTETAMANTLKHTHGRYAAYWNARQFSSGHVWQGRFYSCPLDDSHLWEALRYTELNPVRAGMVAAAEQWQWSSAAVHCNKNQDQETWLAMSLWRKRWSAASWRDYLTQGESQAELAALRRCTYTGRPRGTAEFVAGLEHSTLRLLAPRKGGRPKKSSPDPRQQGLAFTA